MVTTAYVTVRKRGNGAWAKKLRWARGRGNSTPPSCTTTTPSPSPIFVFRLLLRPRVTTYSCTEKYCLRLLASYFESPCSVVEKQILSSWAVGFSSSTRLLVFAKRENKRPTSETKVTTVFKPRWDKLLLFLTATIFAPSSFTNVKEKLGPCKQDTLLIGPGCTCLASAKF